MRWRLTNDDTVEDEHFFPEEVIVIGSIASGWSGHTLCMDHCPMALGILRNVIYSAVRRRTWNGWMAAC
jgi:hypothetical protein